MSRKKSCLTATKGTLSLGKGTKRKTQKFEELNEAHEDSEFMMVDLSEIFLNFRMIDEESVI